VAMCIRTSTHGESDPRRYVARREAEQHTSTIDCGEDTGSTYKIYALVKYTFEKSKNHLLINFFSNIQYGAYFLADTP
jgi:hypothetical protein